MPINHAERKASADAEPKTPIRLLSKAQVLEKIGRSYPTVWAWMRAGRFPRAVDLNGRPAWVEASVEAWIAALPLRRLKGDGRVPDAPLGKSKQKKRVQSL